MDTQKKDIKAHSLDELSHVLKTWHEPSYRTNQIYHWLYAHSVTDFNSMKNLSASLRNQLSQHFFISQLKSISHQRSFEGPLSTQKFLFELHDGKTIESVLIPSQSEIPSKPRYTVCVSTQVGCPLSCSFCATGKMGFSRNLSIGEIVDQVAFIQNWLSENYDERVTNVVFMGMGEPLLNVDPCLEAIRIFSNPDYRFKISERRITLSTIGLVPGIQTLLSKNVNFKLAVSLHSANESLRNQLIPASKDHPLEKLKQVLKEFNAINRHPVTLEYVLLKGFNDQAKDAQALKRFAKGLRCKINLIDFNMVEGTNYRKTSEPSKHQFIRFLIDQNLKVTARKSRGQSKNAACGQLATLNSGYHRIRPKLSLSI